MFYENVLRYPKRPDRLAVLQLAGKNGYRAVCMHGYNCIMQKMNICIMYNGCCRRNSFVGISGVGYCAQSRCGNITRVMSEL